MNKIKYSVAFLTLFCCALNLSAQSAVTELNFYKKQSQGEDKKLLQSIDLQLSSWLDKNYSLPTADDALILKADVESRTKNYPAAYVTLLRHKYEFPNSANSAQAAALLSSVVENMPKNSREKLRKAYAIKSVPKDSDARLAEFLSSATQLEIKGAYDALNGEYRSFFARFPVYENKDRMELMLGDLERFNKNYQAAVMQYKKVYDIYPSTKYKAASLRMLGDIYSSELKDYNQGAYYYNSVIKNFPNSIEIATTYNHLAIMNEKQKDYSSAIDNITKAAEIYLKNAKKDKAYEAYRYKAELQNKKIKDYAGAVDTLNKAADLFKTDETKYIDCKFQAAEIYSKRLKDKYGEIKAYEDIISAYPSAAQTPQALYSAGMASENLDLLPKAKDLYHKLIISHPADPFATKAQRRMNKLDKQSATAAAAPVKTEAKQTVPVKIRQEQTNAAQPALKEPLEDDDDSDEYDIIEEL